ncbi:MAG: malonyl-ACP O-methyltransferase BioC [Gammaproteobacteria bacterium]|nr:malonyl-ACP O-methyltransferase BioC [Gammaproteobacteria bacterium]
MEPEATIDKGQARLAFSRAADRYDEVAVLQRDIGQRMLDRLDLIKVEPRMILDLGAGTGVATEALARQYSGVKVLALDFAFPMLLKARERGRLFRKPGCLCADLEQLPLADDSIDLIYSNAAIQWSNDLEKAFREFLRVLKPGGLLMFTTFGPDTLKELRQAWSEADSHSHVSLFPDMHDVGDALARAGFADPVMDVDRLVMTYQTVGKMMQDLKILGAHNVTRGRQKGLTGKGRLKAMSQAYERHRVDGLLPSSYEVVYGHAWAPDISPGAAVTSIPLSSIGDPRGMVP